MRPSVLAIDARNDAAVLAQSQVEPAEFRALFERHFDAVHRFASARLGLRAGTVCMESRYVSAIVRSDSARPPKDEATSA